MTATFSALNPVGDRAFHYDMADGLLQIVEQIQQGAGENLDESTRGGVELALRKAHVHALLATTDPSVSGMADLLRASRENQ